jgi:hypothetical protein
MERALQSKLREQNQGTRAGQCCAESLAAFLENTLKPAERGQVAHHLSLCPLCRDTLAIISRLPRSPQPINTPSSKYRIAGLAAAAALICLCVAVLYSHSGIRLIARPEQIPAPRSAAQVTPKKDFQPPELVPSQEGTASSSVPILPHLAAAAVTIPKINSSGNTWKLDITQHPAALEKSQDGGRTWQPVSIPSFQPKSILWKDAKVWAIDSQGVIMESNDNGTHWARLQHKAHGSPNQ